MHEPFAPQPSARPSLRLRWSAPTLAFLCLCVQELVYQIECSRVPQLSAIKSKSAPKSATRLVSSFMWRRFSEDLSKPASVTSTVDDRNDEPPTVPPPLTTVTPAPTPPSKPTVPATDTRPAAKQVSMDGSTFEKPKSEAVQARHAALLRTCTLYHCATDWRAVTLVCSSRRPNLGSGCVSR
jgi:hypothetical protein